MTAPFYKLQCVLCRKEYTEEQTVSTCLSCDGALDVIYHKGTPPSAIWLNKKPAHLFEFLQSVARLPIRSKELVSLGEGNTPLLSVLELSKKYGLPNMFIKYEGANPTGVFKDRGSAVEITKALEMGAKAVCCASTGNMAASVAAYCAKAHLPCYVVIPEKTPLGKLAQAIAYGAKVLKVRGSYVECVKLSVEIAKHYQFYLAGDYAFRLEGQKTTALEIVQQLEGNVPDWVVVPVGCGTHLSGIWKGFQELYDLKLVKKVPRFLGVQPENVPTIVNAWQQGKDQYVPTENIKSVASAVAIGIPLDDVKVLRAIRSSRGHAETVSEEMILQAQKTLAKEASLFVEPAAALPLAALEKLQTRKFFNPKDTVVLVVTGTGLKDPNSILSTGVESPVLEPELKEVERYFKMQVHKENGQVSLVSEKQKEVWQSLPSEEKLQQELKKLFKLNLNKESTRKLHEMLQSFQEKEQQIRRGDLEYALDNLLKTPSDLKSVLQIQDFSVHVTQHQPAEAWVLLSYDGSLLASRAKGVGPVDAIIHAVEESIKAKDTTGAKLTHYDVEINTGGTEAVVEVHLSLTGSNGLEVTGEAASPDVIVASIKAYEHAYNLLAWKLAQKKIVTQSHVSVSKRP